MATLSSTNISVDSVADTLGQVIQTKEDQLRVTVANLGPSPSTQDLLLLQQDTAQYTLLIDIQATVLKALSDSLKGIVQKSG